MITIRRALLATLALTVAAAPTLALELGDPAPPLKIKSWVRGQAVDLQAGQDKNVYVIEFWATWCGPCLRSIPHMTELQKKYQSQGVVCIGISSGEELKTVEKFVQKRGDQMSYTVAFDQGKASYEAYMGGFKKNGIPQAFLIDKQGRIVWEGHPLFGLDEVLAKVLTGEYDLKSLAALSEELLKRQHEKEKLAIQYLQLVSSSADPSGASELSKQLLKTLHDDPEMLNMLSWTILTEPAVLARDLHFALQAAQRANELTEGNDPAIMDTYARALWDTGDKQQAIKVQRKAVELTDNERMKAALQKTLQQYERDS